MKRRFEFVEGSSCKFWEISLEGNEVRTCYGKLGTGGRQTVKVAGSVAQATQMGAKLVAEKIGKGYQEVGVHAIEGAAPSEAAASSKSKSKSSASPAPKAAKRKASAKPKPGEAAPVTAASDVFPLIDLLVEQMAKHGRIEDNEIAVLVSHGGRAHDDRYLAWLETFPKASPWRAALAAGVAIERFYAGRRSEALAALAHAQKLLPKVAVTYFHPNDELTSASLAVSAAELLLGQAAAGQARLDKISPLAGDDSNNRLALLSTLLVAQQWAAAKALTMDSSASSMLSLKPHAARAIACALRAEKYDLLGELFQGSLEQNNHEEPAYLVSKLGRPRDLLELCVCFPGIFAQSLTPVIDALLALEKSDSAQAHTYATKLSELDDVHEDVALGCAAHRFRNDPQGALSYLAKHPELGLEWDLGTKLRRLLAGQPIDDDELTGDILRFIEDRDLVEKRLLASARIRKFYLVDSIGTAETLVRFGRNGAALGLLEKLRPVLDDMSKSDRATPVREMARVLAKLGEATRALGLKALVTPGYHTLVLTEIVVGAMSIGDWAGAFDAARKMPDAHINDRKNALANALRPSWL